LVEALNPTTSKSLNPTSKNSPKQKESAVSNLVAKDMDEPKDQN
jgi:hypothetical protein